jgi:hypothetical protein
VEENSLACVCYAEKTTGLDRAQALDIAEDGHLTLSRWQIRDASLDQIHGLSRQ